jgi:DNA-binding CsgD family transcriptional regulator
VSAALRLPIVDDAVMTARVTPFLATECRNFFDTGASRPVVSDVDIILYGTFAQILGADVDMEDFGRDSGAKVGIYLWSPDAGPIERTTAGDASGRLSDVLTGPEIIAVVERVMNGEKTVVPGGHESDQDGSGDWLGPSAGLTLREAEIVQLITQGLSNQEIADRAFLSINSVKTYIRTAYRKINVTRRSQAVLWGVDNGFRPHSLPIAEVAVVLRRRTLAQRPATT